MSSSKEPRILVLTLYSGENEIEACKSSVAKQKGVLVTHEIFENLPNIEAHRALYARIMEKSKTYDWFVKLDADMVLQHDMSLKNAIQHIEKTDKNADMAIFTVQDNPTNMPIWGINFFSPSCHWDWVAQNKDIPDNLFVDPDPVHNGARLIIHEPPTPIATHMENPSDWQAFFFGAHRALKALAMDGDKPSSRAKTQWNILRAVGKHYKCTKNSKLALILAGAEYMRTLDSQAQLPDTLNKDNSNLQNAFNELKVEELEKIAAFWTSSVKPIFHWYIHRGGWKLILKQFR